MATVILIALVLLVLLGVLVLGGRWLAWSLVRSAPTAEFFYPPPPAMPAVVKKGMPALLEELESHLASVAPKTLASLRPGLSMEQVEALEAEFDIVLTDDLRALYVWRDGTDSWTNSVVPGHRFTPLQQALEEREALRAEVKDQSAVQIAAYAAFAGHRDPWISVFVDAAGDGYFYDPERRDSGGHFFFHFAEDSDYIYYPSLKNFLAGVNTCYEANIIHTAPDGSIDEDYERSREVWLRYGAQNPIE